MATNPISGVAAPVTLPGTFPPMPAVARILARHDRRKLVAFVTVAIDLLDVLDGDGDLEGECSEDEVSRCTDIGRAVEGDGAGCDISDAGENAWLEWTTMRGSQKRGPNIAGHEDDEDDGDAGDHSASEDDCPGIGTRALQRLHSAPGCKIGDPGGCEHDGREPDHDAEAEQMPGDVPAPHVYSLDHNLFNDQRTLLARPGPGGSVYFKVGDQTWRGMPV
ncbi:hypothetical protein [Novosphingobium sp.]|uniref:hypothetical protein n=1 Tax=Novosphingobium sp. TaxID=1874826 RepID=UPI0025D63290|nr:hypothetical protein [Novosphingobium sp.]